MPVSNKTMYRKGDEVFLYVNGEWYAYDLRMQPLGAGAMGTVYRGRSCMHPGVIVAIKQVNSNFAEIPSVRARARLEAGLMFRHRNLIEMIGICEYSPSKGPIFIVSNLVHGVNLDVFVRNNLRGREHFIRNVCKCFYPVLDALDYLHGKDIFHLDIKPSNIMVENGSNIRLMDLGIAAVDSGNEASASGLLGTPEYAAPEQCLVSGHHMTIDATTDIYETGVTLYEMLTGENPYYAPTMSRIIDLHKTVLLPYTKSIPNELVDVLRKATAFSQRERYQTAGQLKLALMSVVEEIEHPKGFFQRFFG